MATDPEANNDFQPAPVDQCHTLPAVYDWNAENNADQPMARWHNSNENVVHERTWGEGVQIFRRLASQILAKLGPGAGETIGILATTGIALYSRLEIDNFHSKRLYRTNAVLGSFWCPCSMWLRALHDFVTKLSRGG